MATGHAGNRGELAKVVERQMRNWELARTQKVAPAAGKPAPEVADFVAVSRLVGSGGGAVARALAARLGWPVFDREILQSMAGDDAVRKRLYEHMDERDTSWIEEALRWILHGKMPRHDYFHRLSEAVLAIARQGPAVFLGRGADLILPATRGLRVRIIAPREQCVRNVAARAQCSPERAEDEINRIQGDREEYIRNQFGVSAGDPARHDLIISLRNYSVDDAVAVIIAAMRVRGLAVPDGTA